MSRRRSVLDAESKEAPPFKKARTIENSEVLESSSSSEDEDKNEISGFEDFQRDVSHPQSDQCQSFRLNAIHLFFSF